MLQKVERFKSSLFNIPGWHTPRKIIVFESDDWGSIRIPSKNTHDYLLNLGYPIDKSPYGKDSLESNEDLAALLDILSVFKNSNGQHPVFTINNIVANPNFKKIREANFNYYYYEPFSETYKKYPDHNKSLELIREGVRRNLFRPQLHGREHLNIKRWINSLKTGQPETVDLFNHNMYGLPQFLSREHKRTLQRAFDYDTNDEQEAFKDIINEATEIFREIWDYDSLSFIAPNFLWNDYIEKCLAKKNIKFLQGLRAQIVPALNGKYKVKYHFTGQKNRIGQIYLVRNCYFEPAFDKYKDWVDSCLSEISIAFRLRKPAILSTHRVNYIGGIDIENRNRGLKNLSTLLKAINTKWPEAEFMSTDQLGDCMLSKGQK